VADEITEPGVYEIPEDLYHRDPVKGGSLSYSGAKKLLAEGGPELFAYEREHPPAPSQEMELGTAAHKLVLGVGQEIAVLEFDNYQKGDAKKARDEARAAGKLPLLTHQHETVRAMAARLREHDWASRLLNQDGAPEMSAFWEDPEFGTWWRCRWDKMPEPDPRRVPILGDYKTTDKGGAAPTKFSKAIADFRYYMQASVYTAGYNAVFGDRIGGPALFSLIAQERVAPYRVAVYELHPNALRKGREDARKAMAIYRECQETGVWPGYDPDPQVIDLPYWAYRNEDY
jgi:hypothetical protein